MKKRSNSKPVIEMPIWKQDGKLWFADANDLGNAIRDSGLTEDNLRRKLGAGYSELQEAIKGKRLDGWTVSHLEWGLKAD